MGYKLQAVTNEEEKINELSCALYVQVVLFLTTKQNDLMMASPAQ